jgi:hypothetical protein
MAHDDSRSGLGRPIPPTSPTSPAGPTAPGGPGADEARMRALLGRVQGQQRRVRRRLGLAAGGAAVALVAGTAVVAIALTGSPATTTGTASVASAASPASGVSARLGIGPRRWGSLLVLRLRDRHGPRRCQLVVVPRSGPDQTLATWSVAAGNRTGPVTIYADTYLRRAQISAVQVRSTTGTTLLNLRL